MACAIALSEHNKETSRTNKLANILKNMANPKRIKMIMIFDNTTENPLDLVPFQLQPAIKFSSIACAENGIRYSSKFILQLPNKSTHTQRERKRHTLTLLHTPRQTEKAHYFDDDNVVVVPAAAVVVKPI